MNRDIISWIVFLAIVSVIVFSINFYIGIRLTGEFPLSSIWRPITWCLIVGLCFVVLASPLLRFFNSKIGESLARTLTFVGYSYLAFMVVMVFVLGAMDLLYLLSKLFLSKEVFDSERRAFVFGYAPWAALGVSGLLSAKGYRTAAQGPEIFPIVIKKKNLPSGLQGLKVAQISDLHVSSTIRRGYVEDVVKKTMDAKPDVILLTGDLVDGSYAQLKEDVDPLKKLQAPMGVYYVTGNHEYYWGHEDWEKVFSGFGFQVLHNTHKVTEKNGAKLVVGGVPDFTYESMKLGKVDATKALEGAPKADFVIFMVHQPEGYKLVKDLPCDLQVSGHTHAGQFFPASLFIGLFHKYAKGLHNHEGKFWVYVNQGTGYWGPINRLGVPAEITLFTLDI